MSLHDSMKMRKIPSLELSCRTVVVNHLERYPPEAMGMLSEEAWESVVLLRHSKTKPQNGHGGLDGTGRMAPAISAKYLQPVEEANPHLAESSLADTLVWKDCVNQRFKRGGMLRPVALNTPWPNLVESLKSNMADMMQLVTNNTTRDEADDIFAERSIQVLDKSIQALEDAPMNVALLQATQVGKGVRKFLKACSKQQRGLCTLDIWTEQQVRGQSVSPKTRLEQVLQKWMSLAKASGVSMSSSSSATSIDSNNDKVESDLQQQHEDDLRIAQQCASWRELYTALVTRESETRANQGARMREIRKNLNKDRPKIVKVRPSNPKHNRMLEKRSTIQTTKMVSPKNKMQQLRAESAVAASWQKSSSQSKRAAMCSTATARPKSFGAAVAFASGDSKNSSSRNKRQKVIALGGGKSMKLPKKKAVNGVASREKGPTRWPKR